MTRKVGLNARSASIQAAIQAGKGNTTPAGSARPGADTAAKSRGKAVALSVRLDGETHEALRLIAFEKRVSIHSLLMDGVKEVIRKSKA